MTRVATVPALARLKAQFARQDEPRVFVHRGTCGDAMGAPMDGAVRDALRAALGSRAVETACDGACWAVPAATVQRDGHQHRFARLDLVEGVPDELTSCLEGDCDDEYAGRGQYGLLERVGRNDGTFADVLARGGYAALAHAAGLDPRRVIGAVESAGHAATAERWRIAAAGPGPRSLVAAAAEGEAGLFKDRHLLEGDPHRLIEGVLIACHAVGIDRATICLDGQTPDAQAAVEAALAQAGKHGILDGSALRNRPVTVEVRRGGDAAGDEPVVEDVETLCAITMAFDSPPPPTRLIALSGAVPRPGLYETPVDGNTTWTGVLALAGVAPGLVPAILLGGTRGRLLLPEEFETPLTRGGLGAGSVVVLPRDADLDEVARSLAR